MLDILDPTISVARERIEYAPRPRSLTSLRIGIVENTRRNSESVLRKLADNLRALHGMSVETVLHKHQRAPLSDAQLSALKGKVDFALAGVGD